MTDADREHCPTWVVRIMEGENERGQQNGTAVQQELVTNAKQYIAGRPGARIRLLDVGKALGVSAAYVTEVFHQVTGVPFYRYALQTRLERAIRLLPGYPHDLTTLALELGFSSHSHFTTAFRQAFGCTPAVFRERARRVCSSIRSSASQRVETPTQSICAHPARPATA